MSDANQISSLEDVAIVITAVFVSIFLLISSIWICKYYLCPSAYTDPTFGRSHTSSTNDGTNNNANIFAGYVDNSSPTNSNIHHLQNHNNSEHPIVPFSTKVRSIFLEQVLQHETFHPHKTCTTGTADDLEKGCHSTNTVTAVPIATPIDDSPDAALDDIEAPAQSKLTEVKHSEDSMYTTSTEDMKADTVNVCNVSPVLSGDDSTCGHDQDDATTSDDSSGSDNMNETCAICYDALQDGDEITTSNCAKTFHRTCIITWLMLHDTCPYCRNTFKNINDNKNIDAILANDIFDCD